MSLDYYLRAFVASHEDKLYSKIAAVADGRYPESAGLSRVALNSGIARPTDYQSAINAKFRSDDRHQWPMKFEYTPR